MKRDRRNPAQLFQQALDHQRAGRLAEAQAIYRRLLEIVPNDPDTLHFYGVLRRQMGHLDEAIRFIRRSIELNPSAAQYYTNLGNTLQARGDLTGAADAFRKSLALRPGSAVVHNNLANLLQSQGRLDDAAEQFEQAVKLMPDLAEAHSNLGMLYKDQGRLEEALGALRQALALKPDFVAAHSNLLYTMVYDERYTSADLLAATLEWNQRHAAPLAASIQPHANAPMPDRRLRIGYVSPYFRHHATSHFTMPLLAHHDHARFEVFAYSGVRNPDALTQRFQGCADHWRVTLGLSDQSLAELVRADQIDILVDVTMHMEDGRLLAFARKPAPVQITWLAYPGTTGLSAMDYRFTDPYLAPAAEDDSLYAEQSIRLPCTFWCYDPFADEPAENPLPALANGHVTFGCLNNFCKINRTMLALWDRILSGITGARLLILAPEGAHRRRLLEAFSVDHARIEFVSNRPRSDYLELYRRIDLCLDTLPYNGHTTTLDGFWMGVPAVTLVGQTEMGRAGWSMLNNLGMQDELAAWEPDEYVRLAVELAHDLPRLARYRETLRARMLDSPLMDGRRFAADVEAAYRKLWSTWCQEQAEASRD